MCRLSFVSLSIRCHRLQRLQHLQFAPHFSVNQLSKPAANRILSTQFKCILNTISLEIKTKQQHIIYLVVMPLLLVFFFLLPNGRAVVFFGLSASFMEQWYARTKTANMQSRNSTVHGVFFFAMAAQKKSAPHKNTKLQLLRTGCIFTIFDVNLINSEHQLEKLFNIYI